MKNSKTASYVIAIIGLLWVIVLLVAVALVGPRPAETAKGSIEKAVYTFEKVGMSAGGVGLVDFYGEDAVAAGVVCPGMTEKDAAERYQVDASSLQLGDTEVPMHLNYLLVAYQDGSVKSDALQRDTLDLCTGTEVVLPANRLILLAKTKDGGWALLG